jgi:hypothetical protein
MGMFDYISCEMPLPRGGADTIPTFRYDHQFQTKDLVNCLIEYKIGKDNFTGYITFCDILHDVDSTHDAWVDYRVHVKSGEAQGDVELTEYRLDDNTENKANQAKWKEEAKARKEYEEKWRYKYCFKYWNKLVRFKFRILRKVFNWVHGISGNLWRLERKITF